ncbi:MAG: hypothetical protein V1767_00810 [Chloroflexota bacterium]
MKIVLEIGKEMEVGKDKNKNPIVLFCSALLSLDGDKILVDEVVDEVVKSLKINDYNFR